MFRDFIHWIHGQLDAHYFHDARGPDLRILLSIEQQRELITQGHLVDSPHSRFEDYCQRDPKTGLISTILGVEVVTTMEANPPLVVRLASI